MSIIDFRIHVHASEPEMSANIISYYRSITSATAAHDRETVIRECGHEPYIEFYEFIIGAFHTGLFSFTSQLHLMIRFRVHFYSSICGHFFRHSAEPRVLATNSGVRFHVLAKCKTEKCRKIGRRTMMRETTDNNTFSRGNWYHEYLRRDEYFPAILDDCRIRNHTSLRMPWLTVCNASLSSKMFSFADTWRAKWSHILNPHGK